MNKYFEGNVKLYNEEFYVNTNTGEGVDRVLRKIDPLLFKMSNSLFITNYSQEDLNIMFDVFTLLERHPDSYLTYMQGLNSIMTPRNTEIKKWINDKIVY